MKASELIEKIHNNEIREGTKIICHKKNEYFDYEFTRYFMGNWFSKVPAEQHTGDDDFDKDMILELCDGSVTYRIVDERELNECLSQQKEFIEYLEDEKDRLAREISNLYEDSLGHTRLVNEDIFDEINDILQKYKSIIGVSDEKEN